MSAASASMIARRVLAVVRTCVGWAAAAVAPIAAQDAPPPVPTSEPPARAAAIDDVAVHHAIVVAREAVVADPTDGAALARLIDALVAAGHDDEALTWVVRLGRGTGDVQFVETWTARLDPLADERRAALARAAARWIERAEQCAARALPLNAAALFDGALALAAEDDALTARALQGRRELVSNRKARERLARHGAPLRASEDRDAIASEDPTAPWPGAIPGLDDLPPPDVAARLAADKPARVRGRHYDVTTVLGRDVAALVSRVLEELHDILAERFHDDRSRPTLDVEMLVDAREFRSRRPGGEGRAVASPWELAWYEPEARRIVALDPRQIGEPFEVLWGVLAREAAREFAQAMAVPPPVWVEEGLCLDYEGVRLRADGSLNAERPPVHRMDEVALALRGRGPPRPDLPDVLQLTDRGGPWSAWAWALMRYLRTGEDGRGERLWADRLDRLLADYREGSIFDVTDERFALDLPDPQEHFKQRILPLEEETRAGVTNLREVEHLMQEWVRHHSALALDKTAAVTEELDVVARRVERGDPDELARRLQEVLAVRPEAEAAWRLLAQVESRRHDKDAALLAARRVAALSAGEVEAAGHGAATPDGTAPSEGAPPRASDTSEARFAAMARLDSRLAADCAEDEATLRADVLALVDRYAASDHPRTALRLLQAALGALPFDAELCAARDALLQRPDVTDVELRRPIPLQDRVAAAFGDKSMWTPAATGGLTVLCEDRVEAASLRGLARLTAPCVLECEVQFRTPAALDDGTRLAGLTLGAGAPEGRGEWGLFASPGGRLELATPGLLEWPSTPLGRVRQGKLHLRLTLERDAFALEVNDVDLGSRPLGARPPDGWLGLWARRADVIVLSLVVTEQAGGAGRVPWFARGRP